MRRALVTGGAGFLGSHLVRALAGEGWEVRSLDLRFRADRGGEEGIESVETDVRDADAVARAASGCHVVIDNAALVPLSRASRTEYRSVNVEGCRATLEAARREGAYVVHISSSAVYGVPKELPVTDATPLAPFEPYGESKAEAEGVVERARRQGLRVASLRPRTLVGEGRLGLFDLIFSRVSAGKSVPLFGSGHNAVQLCDVGDFCAATLAAIERESQGDYNIGAAVYGTVREDMEALVAHAGTGARVRPVPVWAIRTVLQPLALVGRSPFNAWHWRTAPKSFYFDLDKAMAELGWQPRRSNVEALTRAYDLYRAPHDHGGSTHRRPLEGGLARVLRG